MADPGWGPARRAPNCPSLTPPQLHIPTARQQDTVREGWSVAGPAPDSKASRHSPCSAPSCSPGFALSTGLR